MNEVIERLQSLELKGRLLCHATIALEGDAPIQLGKTPWRRIRISGIAGGRFRGPRLQGEILRSGADWAEQGFDADDTPTSSLDVRSLWRCDDAALIYVTYRGRLVVPKELFDDFRDPRRIDALDPTSYYFRTLLTFETADRRYTWLNNLVAVGFGRRTAPGVDYKIYEIL